MTSLRASIASLQRYAPEAALNISDVYKFMFMERPVSIRALVAKIASLPESVPFHSTIVTGAAMGGEVSVTLNRNGSYRFSGFMRATGFLSFSFRVGVVVRSASGQVTVATQRSGKVFGTDTPGGDRQFNWDEFVSNSPRAGAIRDLWPDLSGGEMVVSRSSELGGVLGTTIDFVEDVAKFFVVAQTLGASLAICLIIGSELGDAGVDVPGLGGIVGLGIIGGALFIWGPLAIGPAFIIGVAAGAIVDAMIKIRPLRPEEQDFARVVFGNSLDFDKIRLTNLVGLENKPFAVPTVDNHVLLNMGINDEMFNSPMTSARPGEVRGQLFIHELTHAWQIQHASLEHGYVPGWLCDGIGEQVTMGQDAYYYGPAGPPWDSFNLEGQAHMVDDWFAGIKLPDNSRTPSMDPNNSYFGYMENNIRAGVA